MTITLASLVTRLTADVPAQSGVPTSDQYTQAVKDAVADLGRRASVVTRADLAIVAGQASYPMPAGFVRLVRLSTVGAAIGQTLITPAGLVPLIGAAREQITVNGATLTIWPAPTFSATRDLWYAAGHALDTGGYPTLSEERAAIALLHARAACLDRIASSPRADAIVLETGQDTAGRDRLDATKRASELRATAQALREQYLAGVAQLNSAIGGLG